MPGVFRKSLSSSSEEGQGPQEHVPEVEAGAWGQGSQPLLVQSPQGPRGNDDERTWRNPVSVRDQPGTSGLSRHRAAAPQALPAPGFSGPVYYTTGTMEFAEFIEPRGYCCRMNSSSSEASAPPEMSQDSVSRKRQLRRQRRGMRRVWFSAPDIRSMCTGTQTPSVASAHKVCSQRRGKSHNSTFTISSLSDSSLEDDVLIHEFQSLKRRASESEGIDEKKWRHDEDDGPGPQPN